MEGPVIATEGAGSHAPSARDARAPRSTEGGGSDPSAEPPSTCEYDLEGQAAGTLSPPCGDPVAASPLADAPAAAQGRAHRRLGVLRHRHFRNVWLGAFGASLGGWMEHVGIRWVMTEMTTAPGWSGPDANAMISYLTVASLVPTLLLGMVAGLITDRVNRKTLLLVSRVSMMFIAVGLAVISYFSLIGPGVLLVLSALQGVAIAFDIPASQVLTPRLVPREELTEAIHLNGVQFNMARVLGPALGGAILSWTSTTSLFVINAVSFVGVLISVWGTPDAPAPPRAPNGRSVLGQAGSDIAEAMSFVFHRRGPRAAFLALVVFAIFATPMMQLLPVFVHQVYHRQESAFGIMLGVMGSGAVTGGFLVRRVPKWYPMHHFIPVSVLLGGVTIFLFAIMPSPLAAGVFLFLSGIFWMWAFNSSMAVMQLLVDDAMRGRVLAVCNTVALGLMPVGTILASMGGRWLTHVYDAARGTTHPATADDIGREAQVGVAMCAVLLIAAGIVMLVRRTPEIDGAVPDGAPPERGFLRGLTAGEHRPNPGVAPAK